MLANIPLDIQITICIFLHPCDILALRRTCKAFQLATRRRVVWVAALHRVCFENSIFLPSFPVPAMSVVELEQAAIVPRRWIELCAAFQRQHPKGSGAILHPQTTRIIEDPGVIMGYLSSDVFLVPGGRYLVSSSHIGIFVWDLGYTSSADCKLIASVERPKRELGGFGCMVQPTPDGMGLTILSFYEYYGNYSIYEIYPQNEIPQLIQIAHLDIEPSEDSHVYLLPDTMIWYDFFEDGIVFRVWDYRVNSSISFSAHVDLEVYDIEVIATKTVIIVLCEEILVWAIPPLSPQSLDFSDHNSIHIPPLFRLEFPEFVPIELIGWNTTSYWYFGTSQPLYFDILCQDSKLHRFQILIKPDLSDASLQVINTSEPTPHDFRYVSFGRYVICEDTLVSCWDDCMNGKDAYGVYTGLTSSHSADVVSPGGPAAKMLLPTTMFWCSNALCPLSGRLVHPAGNTKEIVVLDFF